MPPSPAYGSLPTSNDPHVVRTRAASRRRHILTLVACVVLTTIVLRLTGHAQHSAPGKHPARVSVDLFVMSKCPDAKYCEGVFAGVLGNVANITSLKTHYIVSPSLTCMHGDSECAGNIQQLCVRHHHPSPSHWFSFILCSNSKQSQIPDDPATCAKTAGFEWSAAVQECAESKMGQKLLARDAKIAWQKGIKRSCTVQLQGKTACVRDGGEWNDGCVVEPDEPEEVAVDKFTAEICGLYKGKHKPAACLRREAS
ncbi:hypothetical protein HDU86_008509 [Geranomyces michiganensis]|nr:hypothetical protein HDU86_008509 [Geranomyces michiganensis]